LAGVPPERKRIFTAGSALATIRRQQREEQDPMPKINRIAHFSIPVTDMDRSVRFYTEVIGCTHLRGGKDQTFLDAGGTCILLCLEKPPINRPDQNDFVHHAFDIGPEQYATIGDHLKRHGVEVMYEEDRSGGTVNGPRLYFRDPDGTRLEFINLTQYDTSARKKPKVTEISGDRTDRPAARA
jgi:catechol 2,3-dioxygenase-like lactoylglutathione lyase family enzyme